MALDPVSGSIFCLDDRDNACLLRRVDPDGRITILARDAWEARYTGIQPMTGPAFRLLGETGGLGMARNLVYHQGYLCWTDLLTRSLQAFDPHSCQVRTVMPSGPLRADLPLACAAPDLLPEECACAGEIRRMTAYGHYLLLFDGRTLTRLSLPPAPRNSGLP